MPFKVFAKEDVEGIRAFREQRDANEQNRKFRQANALMDIFLEDILCEDVEIIDEHRYDSGAQGTQGECSTDTPAGNEGDGSGRSKAD